MNSEVSKYGTLNRNKAKYSVKLDLSIVFCCYHLSKERRTLCVVVTN